MRNLALFGLAAILCGPALAQDNRGIDNGTSLGDVTKDAIAAGFDQGGHSSDPSGDGKGKGDGDQPRAGLANAVSKSDLSATIDLIDGD